MGRGLQWLQPEQVKPEDLPEDPLAGTDGRPLLRNGDFDRGLAHWLPAAQSYFVPWHIDSLALESLIERGAPAPPRRHVVTAVLSA